jgi:hypothetical protein
VDWWSVSRVDRGLETRDARGHMIDLVDVVEQRRFLCRLIKADRTLHPHEVGLGPRFYGGRRSPSVPQQKLAQPMARTQLVLLRRFSGTHQIAQRFVRRVGYPQGSACHPSIHSARKRGLRRPPTFTARSRPARDLRGAPVVATPSVSAHFDIVTQPVTGIRYILTMTNDALLWNAPPPPPRKPSPTEHVWSMRKNGKQVDAEPLGHGEWGWECQFLYNGELADGRLWTMRAEALAEAEKKRREPDRE